MIIQARSGEGGGGRGRPTPALACFLVLLLLPGLAPAPPFSSVVRAFGFPRPPLSPASHSRLPPPRASPLRPAVAKERPSRGGTGRSGAATLLASSSGHGGGGKDWEGGDGSGGSILGASLLFAGTAVGAGMLALPAETIDAGFVPSVAGLTLCWAFTYVTSLYTLEASWMATELARKEAIVLDDGGGTTMGKVWEGRMMGKIAGGGGGGGGGFLAISRRALGVPGELVTGMLFWFLLTSIVVAYTSEGGQLVAQLADGMLPSLPLPSVSSPGAVPPAALGSVLFAAFFGSLATTGTSRVDSVNRILVAGLAGAFLGLAGLGLPRIDISNLFGRADWGALYPAGISVGILSFGAQNVVPTLLAYLGDDPVRTRRAILLGSLAPLVLYAMWEAVFLGIVPGDAAASGMEVVEVLGQAGGNAGRDLVGTFSACAVGSSMAGASVSLVDFFEDLIALSGVGVGQGGRERGEEDRPGAGDSGGSAGDARLLAAVLALGPPVLLSYTYPDIFLTALEEAGLLGGVSLYGVLPALSIWSLRRSSADMTMPGRLGGGDGALCALFLLSSGLVLPEIVRLAASSGVLLLHH